MEREVKEKGNYVPDLISKWIIENLGEGDCLGKENRRKEWDLGLSRQVKPNQFQGAQHIEVQTIKFENLLQRC